MTQLDITGIISLFAQAQVVEPEEVPPVARDSTDDKFLARLKLPRPSTW